MPSRAKQACISGVCKAEGKCFVAHFSEGEEPSTQENHQLHPVDLRIYSGEVGFQKVWLLATQYTPCCVLMVIDVNQVTNEKTIMCIYKGEISLSVKELLSNRIH